MKSLLRIAIAAAAAAVIVEIARRLGLSSRNAKDVPVLRPIADAQPRVTEPIGEEDLRVAQNAPF